MRAGAPAIFFLAALASGARAASIPDEIDGLLASVVRNNTALGGKCVARKVELIDEAGRIGPGAACREDFSLARELEGGEKAAGYGFIAMARYVCLSLAGSDAAPCDALKPLPPSTTGRRESRCRWFYRRGALLRALLTDAPEAKALCVESLDDPGTDHDDVVMGCGLITRYKDDVDSVCRDFIAAQKEVTQSLGPCQKDLRNTLGIGRGLTLLLDGEEMADYGSLGEAYRKALKAGTAQACGDNHLCRALMTRDPAACAPYETELRAAACGGAASAAYDPKSWAALKISSIPASDVFRYFVCRGFVEASAEPCRELNRLEGRPPESDDEGSPAHVCRSYFAEGSLSKALVMKGAGAQGTCELMTAGMLSSPDDAGRVCSVLVNERKDLESVCHMALPLLKGHKTVMDASLCARQLRGLWGDREVCAPAKDAQETEICELGALLRKAGPEGRMSACGDNLYCRALLGGGEAACVPFAQGVSRALGAGQASPARRRFEETEAECSALARENERLFKTVRALLDRAGAAEDRELHDLDSAYTVLRRSHERLLSRLARLRYPSP